MKILLLSIFMMFGFMASAQKACVPTNCQPKDCIAKECNPEQCKKMVELGLCTKEEAAKCIKKCEAAKAQTGSMISEITNKETKVASAILDKEEMPVTKKKCCATKTSCSKKKE